MAQRVTARAVLSSLLFLLIVCQALTPDVRAVASPGSASSPFGRDGGPAGPRDAFKEPPAQTPKGAESTEEGCEPAFDDLCAAWSVVRVNPAPLTPHRAFPSRGDLARGVRPRAGGFLKGPPPRPVAGLPVLLGRLHC